MSASARARASQKYKSRLSLDRGGLWATHRYPNVRADRARRFRKRRKADAARNFSAADLLVNLNRSQRSHLVNEDPVTCCVYFNKLVDTIMAMLQAKMTYNPFGPYRVLDYFLRIEFQHRGSPHAHVLLWLENDPHEKISENMPKTSTLD
ncbi:helitron_like_N domain-containing protein [Trichonephila clavipes]|nr:helitron_like_N domain-containing protein [Trichonephila clavipes]